MLLSNVLDIGGRVWEGVSLSHNEELFWILGVLKTRLWMHAL